MNEVPWVNIESKYCITKHSLHKLYKHFEPDFEDTKQLSAVMSKGYDDGIKTRRRFANPTE